MGFDWSDYVKRREGLSWPHLPLLTESEVAEINRGGWPPEPSGPEGMRREAEYQQWLKAPSGMGEQPSIINRDPGDESRADVDGWYVKAERDAARIADLEAEIARLHQAHEQYVAAQQTLAKNACDWRDAEIAQLRAALVDLAQRVAGPTIGASDTKLAQFSPNALAHSEPKPAWLR